MDDGSEPGSSPEHARTSSWGGRAAWSQLQAIAEETRRRTGFGTAAIEVLRGDGLLELVAFSGPPRGQAATGGNYSISHAHRVEEQGRHHGRLVFLAEEDMDAELQKTIREYGYVPRLPPSTDPRAWRDLDMLVGHLKDDTGRTRALLHLDEPLSGRRPTPADLDELAASLEFVFEMVLATVDREELARRARLDECARAVVRAASHGLAEHDLLAAISHDLMTGFSASALTTWLLDSPIHDWLDVAVDPVTAIELHDAVEDAVRRAWERRVVLVVDRDDVWGDEVLGQEHRALLVDQLGARGADELLLVPVGAGPECMGAIVVTRLGVDRWTTAEAQAALSVGHDVGRSLLSTRAHERERRLIEQLRQLDTYRRRLIATMSHELKNPLGVIVGHVEMLSGAPVLSPEVERSLAALGRSATRLTGVVDDLLLLSRVGDPDHPVEREPIALDRLVDEVLADEVVRAEQQHVSLRRGEPWQAVEVRGAGEELRSVVANLVSNAVKYSRSGGMVTLSIDDTVEGVVLSCTDDGLGISAADQERLCTEFFRSTNPDAISRPGTGLGLAIVHRIVERHGGQMEVRSTLGVGSTFRVVLPRERVPART